VLTAELVDDGTSELLEKLDEAPNKLSVDEAESVEELLDALELINEDDCTEELEDEESTAGAPQTTASFPPALVIKDEVDDDEKHLQLVEVVDPKSAAAYPMQNVRQELKLAAVVDLLATAFRTEPHVN
jgi:hypothetical protein